MTTTPQQEPAGAREAFEARSPGAFHWKRGGTAFAEDVPAEQYADPGVQAHWELWRDAWIAASAASGEAERVPEGFVLVPMRETQAMRDVFDEEGWEWADLLAAAEAVTLEQYNELAAAPKAPASAGKQAPEAASPSLVEGDEFNDGQWWYQELDAIAKSLDQRRAMAVIRNLMRQLEQARTIQHQPKGTELVGHFIEDFGGEKGRWQQCKEAADYTVPLFREPAAAAALAAPEDEAAAAELSRTTRTRLQISGWAYSLDKPCITDVDRSLQVLQNTWDYCDDITRNGRTFGATPGFMRAFSDAITVMEDVAQKYADSAKRPATQAPAPAPADLVRQALKALGTAHGDLACDTRAIEKARGILKGILAAPSPAVAPTQETPQATSCSERDAFLREFTGGTPEYRAWAWLGWQARAALSASRPSAAPEQTQAAIDVLAERHRQVSVEGWTPEHDDEHDFGQLARAGAAYAAQSLCAEDPELECGHPSWWPWERAWWKPTSRRGMLIKAGALILAEIERLDRAAAPTSKQEVDHD